MSRVRPFTVVLLACLGLALAGCSGAPDPQPDVVEWRNVRLDIPQDWYVYERSDAHLSISNADLAARQDEEQEFEPPDEGVVAMAFTYEPDASPDDWREFVGEQDATLESDVRLTLDDNVPATQLVFSYTTAGVATREMVVLVPSRAIVVLSRPIPLRGQDDAPEIFLEHIETFLDVLESAEFGKPVMD